MRNVYFDGSFFSKNITGIQRFSREIIKELDSLLDESDSVFVVVPDKNEVDTTYNRIKVVEYQGVFNGYLWSLISFPSFVRKQKGLAINLCNRPTIGVKGITCLHDIIYKTPFLKCHTVKDLIKRIWNQLNYYLIVHSKNAIITVSEFSKNEIMAKYKCVRNRELCVIHNAWQHMERVAENKVFFEEHKDIHKGEYFFSMASIAQNKNFKWILTAAKYNPSKTFVIAGGGDLKKVADSTGFSDMHNVIFLGYVSDSDAKALMHHCKAFLFPSTYEGFGVPPLEALACGAKKIILSDIPVFHEIFGNCATYIENKDFQCLSNIVYTTESNSSCLQQYSWHDSAVLLFQLISRYSDPV